MSYIGSSGNRCKIFRAGDNDNTPIYRHWEYGRYDAECSCCYLGFAHTEALHERKTEMEKNCGNCGDSDRVKCWCWCSTRVTLMRDSQSCLLWRDPKDPRAKYPELDGDDPGGNWTPAICSADGFSIAINPYIER